METMTLWRWVEMIAQLDDDSMEYVVEGQSNEITAVAGCSLRPRLNSYDHKRHHMLRVGGRPAENKLRIWDFVIHRSDGSEIRLHPQWKTTKVETFRAEGHDEEVEPPRSGLGGTNGPGTNRGYLKVASQRTLRFHPSKKPQ